jgi:hypothetical protein
VVMSGVWSDYRTVCVVRLPQWGEARSEGPRVWARIEALRVGMRRALEGGMTRFCASVSFAGRTFQVAYRTPQELVRALRDMGRSATGQLQVRKVYAKGEAK